MILMLIKAINYEILNLNKFEINYRNNFYLKIYKFC